MTPTSTARNARRAGQLDYVADNLLSRAALLVRLLVKQVRSSELSRTEAEVLGILLDGPRRITELAELTGLAQPTTTLLVKRLEESGWVQREGLAEDGRVVLVHITEAGRVPLEALRARSQAAMRTNLEELSDDQLAALSTATETLSAFIDVLQRRAAP
jgi:DNA-binding MarR family transcriptional regulator